MIYWLLYAHFFTMIPQMGVANTIPVDLWQASISRPIYWLDCLRLVLLWTIQTSVWIPKAGLSFFFYFCWTIAVLTDWHHWDHWCDWLRVYLLITTITNLYFSIFSATVFTLPKRTGALRDAHIVRPVSKKLETKITSQQDGSVVSIDPVIQCFITDYSLL